MISTQIFHKFSFITWNLEQEYVDKYKQKIKTLEFWVESASIIRMKPSTSYSIHDPNCIKTLFHFLIDFKYNIPPKDIPKSYLV